MIEIFFYFCFVKKLLLIYLAVFFSSVLYSQDEGYLYYEKGNQLLIYADEGNFDSVKQMVEDKNADVNFFDYYGVTPLMFASQQGYDSIVIYLIENGANVNLASKDFSITALISAAKNNFLSTAEILIRNGADINAKDVFGRTALHYAAIYGYEVLADMLLYYEAEVDAQDAAGLTPLCYAVENNNTQITMLLRLFDANPNVIVSDSSDLFHLAAEGGNITFLNTFKNDLVLRENLFGLTPVETAIVSGQHESLKWFIDNGVKLRDTINEVYTPRTLAKYSKNFKTKRIIRKLKIHDYHYLFVNRVGGSFDLVFNGDDFFMGTGVVLSEARYGLVFESGILYRGGEKSVLMPIDDDVFYQLREDRKGLYFKSIKNFRLFKTGESSYLNLFAGLRATYWWGDYDGLVMKVNNDMIASPLVGLGLNSGNGFRFYFSAEYLDVPLYGISPVYYSIGINALVNFRKDETIQKYKYIIKY